MLYLLYGYMYVSYNVYYVVYVMSMRISYSGAYSSLPYQIFQQTGSAQPMVHFGTPTTRTITITPMARLMPP